MVYRPGIRDYQRAYNTPSSRPGAFEDENRLPVNLFIAVAVLALATYCLSFGPVVDGSGATGWYIRFAALAGLSAAVGLVANGRPYPMVTAALAVMGFLDALSSQLLTTGTGWAMTAIVVLNGVQAVLAIAALLLWRTADADTAADTGYEAYVEYYNQTMRNYYSQQVPSREPEMSQHGGFGDAAGYGGQTKHRQREKRAPQRGDYADFVSAPGDYGAAAGSPAESSEDTPPSALPRFGPSQPAENWPGRETDQSAGPPSTT